MKTTIPEISIIICCYNHEKWIERCLRSILHQKNIKDSEYEVIIIDDNSSDKSYQIIKKFNFNNFISLKNKKNIGLPLSINMGIKKAQGRYIVRVDSDDYVSRDFLYLIKLFLDLNREYQAVAVDYYRVNDMEQILEKVDCYKKQIACGILFRKECLIDIGLYDKKFKMREGHDLRNRFEKKFKIARLNIPLYKYRTHSENRTNKKKILKKFDKMLEGK
tara:strand:+ start:1006 stop:1662 length:657 start_codon:yes stop_codon:yes gene_type:complete